MNTMNLSQSEDRVRGISVILVALRWDGSPLTRQQLQNRASEAIEIIDRKYNKDIMDVKALEINEPQQFVQLSVRANFSSEDEATQMAADLKSEFGEVPKKRSVRQENPSPEVSLPAPRAEQLNKKWWQFWK